VHITTRNINKRPALLPDEEGNYFIELVSYPQFAIWKEKRRDVRIEGIFTYSLDQFQFKTEFEATIWFSEADELPDSNTKINWRNKVAE
jgi:hypothetical protein